MSLDDHINLIGQTSLDDLTNRHIDLITLTNIVIDPIPRIVGVDAVMVELLLPITVSYTHPDAADE